MNTLIRRPASDESAPYYHHYIDQVEGDDLVEALKKGQQAIGDFLESIPTDKWDHRYAPEKWSIKEVVSHIIETERVMALPSLTNLSK